MQIGIPEFLLTSAIIFKTAISVVEQKRKCKDAYELSAAIFAIAVYDTVILLLLYFGGFYK